MPRFKVAHIKEQGVDLIIVPLDSSFNLKSQEQQTEIVNDLQAHATAAGLAGIIVPVWTVGSTIYFIAPPNWHPFFRSISWNFVLQNINREIYW